jgi:nucleotide sugar dehydrogenase
MRVAVVGCGYVGLVSGAGLASVGHDVVGIEVDPGRRERIAAGSAPFHEPGLPELLEGGALKVSGELRDAADADVVLLAVQTPPVADGSIDLQFLKSAAAELAEAFAEDPQRRRVVAVRSTVIPGTAEGVLSPILGPQVAVASNPEFLREGSAVKDFLHPDRIVVGCDDPGAREVLAELYRPFEAPLVFTSPATAELAKYTSNAFLATLVSFSNEIAHISESLPGVDVEDVLGIIHADRRLSAGGVRPEILSYLKAGCGYGGSCLPKDLSALIAAGEAHGQPMPLLRAVREVNEGQAARVAAAAGEALGGLEGRTVAVLGVAFKAGTDDLRESPGLRIVDELLEQGSTVRVYDPLVKAAALDAYAVEVAPSLPEAIAGAEACILATNDAELAQVTELAENGLVVVDGRRAIDAATMPNGNFVAVGRARAAHSAKHQEVCRSCGAAELVPVLQLGDQPLANALRKPEELGTPERRYPLDLALCTGCSLLQILDSVPPEELFEDYPYFSSVVEALVASAKDLTNRIVDAEPLGPDSLAMEIASNDGYLLQHYRDRGVQVLGIEPAKNIAPVAEQNGIPTRCEFFGEELAQRLLGEGLRPSVIHANNVLAHVPDLNGVVAGIATLIGDWGQAVIEVPYLKDFLDRCAFDTIYHEHLCYFSVTALSRLFERHGLAIQSVELIPIHGQSLRVFLRSAAVAQPDESVRRLLEEEAGWNVAAKEPYLRFAAQVREIDAQLKQLLGDLKDGGARIAAYGAAAKGATLMNTFGLGSETIEFVADASPHKQGLYMPGTDVPIRPPQALLDEAPEYTVLFAWNLVDEIVRQQREYCERGGRFIVPIPEPRVVAWPT